MRLFRSAPTLLPLLALAACSGVQYRDSTAAVDANPACVSRPDQPGEPVSAQCKREQTATWSSERTSKPLDLSDKDDEKR